MQAPGMVLTSAGLPHRSLEAGVRVEQAGLSFWVEDGEGLRTFWGGAMKSKFVLLAVCCLLGAARAQASRRGESQRPRWQVYALEGLGALGGTACCAGCGGVVIWAFAVGSALDHAFIGESEDDWPLVAMGIATAAATPVLAGYGAARAGEQLGEDGSTGWAIGGAYAGAVVGAGLVCLGATVGRSNAVRIPSYVLGGLAVSVGAVAGYNLGGGGAAGGYRPGFGRRLQVPAVALTCVELPDHSVGYGVKVQLAGLRF